MLKRNSFFRSLQNYLRMIKFSHSIFALPFAGIAVIEILYKYYIINPILSWNIKDWILKIIGIILCMVSLRSAAMGFNRIIDRIFDEKNPRTQNREIPQNIISLKNAKIFVFLSTIIFILSAFIINPLAGLLSPLAIALTFGYSYTKRITYFCHFILGFAIGMAPIAVWISLINKVELDAILLSGALMFYIAGFDIIYACMDIEFDRKMNLYSIPAKFGWNIANWIARISHIISILFLILFKFNNHLHIIFDLTILIVIFLFFFEHYLVYGKKIENIPIAFFHVNSIISTVIFFGLLFDRIYFYTI